MKIDDYIVSNEKVFVDVWAPWCGPCKMTTPIVEEIESEFPNIKVLKVNADDDKELVESLEVSAVPTFIYYENGKEIERLVGAINKQAMLSMMKLNT